MTLKQLRYLREVARQSFNITAAAAALHTSQPGISRQILLLEDELGITLLVRRKNRIVALTEAGEAVLSAAQRLLNEVENILLVAEETKRGDGTLTLVTSHLHARYTLLAPLKEFAVAHPNIRALILQADPDDIPALVEHGDADIGISTSDESRPRHPKLAFLNGAMLERCAIMPRSHPLARKERLELRDFEHFPIVGYSPRSRAGQIIAKAFEECGIKLQFVVRANDSDVIKSYVAAGLGIGIIPTAALGEDTFEKLYAVNITELLPKAHMSISVRRDMYLRKYLLDFIQLVSPEWNQRAIMRVINGD